MNERNISPQKVNLTIDREDNTFYAAANFSFNNIKQANSAQSIQVRLADHLCGFIGRMMYAIIDDKSIKEDAVLDIDRLDENDLVSKRLLCPTWFDLQANHFQLYKLVYKVLIRQQAAYWANMTWSYCDQISMFYTLLRYVASYDNYDDFKSHTPEAHSEYYNSACCDELERHYATL